MPSFETYHLPAEGDDREKEKKFISEKIETIFSHIGVDIKKHQEIYSRLIEMHLEKNSHFSDAVEMMYMVEEFWQEEDDRDIKKEKLMLCALLHDVGKDGPCNASPKSRETIRKLFQKDLEFVYKLDGLPDKFRDQRIADVVMTVYPDEYEGRIESLQEIGVDVDGKMRDFFGLHVYWTWDILENNMANEIDHEVAMMAASHHMLEGANPAGIKEEEILSGSIALEMIDKYQALTLIDKYQAFRVRSGLSHEDAISRLEKIIDDSKLSDDQRMRYKNFLNKISEAKDSLESARKKAEEFLSKKEEALVAI